MAFAISQLRQPLLRNSKQISGVRAIKLERKLLLLQLGNGVLPQFFVFLCAIRAATRPRVFRYSAPLRACEAAPLI